MELTRFDLQNQAIQRRIAEALERIAAVLERTHDLPQAQPKPEEIPASRNTP